MTLSRFIKSWFAGEASFPGQTQPEIRKRYGLQTNKGHDFARMLGRSYRLAKRFDESVALFQELAETHRGYGNSNAFLLANSLRHLGKSLIEQAKFEEAASHLRVSLELHDKHSNNWDSDGVGKYYTKFWLGQAVVGLNQNDKAEPLLVEGCIGLVTRQAPGNVVRTKQTTDAIIYLAGFFESHGRHEEAEQWRKELNRVKGQIDAGHPPR